MSGVEANTGAIRTSLRNPTWVYLHAPLVATLGAVPRPWRRCSPGARPATPTSKSVSHLPPAGWVKLMEESANPPASDVPPRTRQRRERRAAVRATLGAPVFIRIETPRIDRDARVVPRPANLHRPPAQHRSERRRQHRVQPCVSAISSPPLLEAARGCCSPSWCVAYRPPFRARRRLATDRGLEGTVQLVAPPIDVLPARGDAWRRTPAKGRFSPRVGCVAYLSIYFPSIRVGCAPRPRLGLYGPPKSTELVLRPPRPREHSSESRTASRRQLGRATPLGSRSIDTGPKYDGAKPPGGGLMISPGRGWPIFGKRSKYTLVGSLLST